MPNQAERILVAKMIAFVANHVMNYISLERFTGPFWNKELRVSSRQKRNYLLRASYIILLLIFVATAWFDVAVFGGSLIYQKSRLAAAGLKITTTIIWFQFYALQVVAILLFCNSLSDEIYHRTLGVLLTTPVSSFQIVAGKLLSKLIQIFLLLAISLPLLAIIRIFGGVPWSYILSSLCIIFAAVFFAGSLTMFFSLLFRRIHVVIILTFSVLGVFNWLWPFLRIIGFRTIHIRRLFEGTLYIFHPSYILDRITNKMLNPGRSASGYAWIIYCFISFFISLLILSITARLLRSIAIANASGRKHFLENIFNLRRFYFSPKQNSTKTATEGEIKHVWGPPVAWKEMKTKFSSREKMFVVIIIGIELMMIFAMYTFPYVAQGIGFDEAQVAYTYIFLGLGVVSTAIFSCVCISSEKETQTWCLLLMTPLSDWQILSGKFIGILRRCIPIWIMLIIYFCPFLSLNISGTGVLSLFLLIILIFAIIIFLYGAGIYFSSRFKNTSAAFLAFFVLLLVIWFFIPFISDINFTSDYLRYFKISSISETFMSANPFVLAQVLMTSDSINVWRYIRWQGHYHDIAESLIIIISIAIAYITAGLIFAWRAKCCFRKNII